MKSNYHYSSSYMNISSSLRSPVTSGRTSRRPSVVCIFQQSQKFCLLLALIIGPGILSILDEAQMAFFQINMNFTWVLVLCILYQFRSNNYDLTQLHCSANVSLVCFCHIVTFNFCLDICLACVLFCISCNNQFPFKVVSQENMDFTSQSSCLNKRK